MFLYFIYKGLCQWLNPCIYIYHSSSTTVTSIDYEKHIKGKEHEMDEKMYNNYSCKQLIKNDLQGSARETVP